MKSWSRGDWLAIAALAAAPVVFFWPHLAGDATFIGDSDRLSHHLTWLQHLAAGLREGRIPTWNEAVFGGYSTVALPYAFPNPLVLVALLWPASGIVYAAGVTSMLLLVLCGFAGYALMRALTGEPFTAFCGAATYALAAPGILRLGQGDGTYLVYAMTPLLLLPVVQMQPGRLRGCYLLLALSLAFLLATGFLQGIVYSLVLLAVVALFVSFRRRDWRALALVAGSCAIAVAIALPRIIGVGREFASSVRPYGEQVAPDFETVYRAANLVYPSQILRWLDDRIFGLTMPEVNLHNSGINLHEGLILYSSSFAAFLVLFGVLRHAPAWIGRQRLRGDVAPALVLFLLFAIFVALTKAGYWVMYQLLFHIDFFHGRITSAAALAQAGLVAIFLFHLAGGDVAKRPLYPAMRWMVACGAMGLAGVAALELAARSFSGYERLSRLEALGPPVTLTHAAVFRIGASLVLFVFLLVLIFLFRRRAEVRAGLACVLGFLAVGQALVHAREQIAGPQLQTDKPPFLEPVRLLAKGDEFHWPTAQARQALGKTLETDRYRIAVVCDRAVIQVPCATFLANFWGLRAVEGYVSSIPLRIAVLPWGAAMSLRYVTFWSGDSLPWSLLGLLNVKHAIQATPALVTNSLRGADGRLREAGPQDVGILHNTLPVTPRVFFAESVEPVANIDEALNRLFPEGKVDQRGYDVVGRSYAEGYSGPVRFARDGVIRARFVDQDAQFDFMPSDQPRFLVVNERFDGDWRAYAGDAELRIYPTNVFMRGVAVPPGAGSVRLHYRPFVQTPMAAAISLLGVALLAFGAMIAGKLDRRYRPHA